MKTIIALLALVCLGTALADTPIYKWVDAQGNVHYSTEPHGDQAQQLAIQNKGILPDAATAQIPASATATNAADAQLLQPMPADSANCKAARDKLFKYLHADNLYMVDSNGQKQNLSAADKAKAVDGAREYVKAACALGAGS